MSVPFLIIDGYNLLHEAGLARDKYGPGDLAQQRHKLLSMLARRMTIEERRRCTVVFDAIDAPLNLSKRFRHDEMVVMFAEPGHEADEVIELLIKQHSAARQLTVVSSDHRLQTAIRHRRGIGLDSDQFLKGLGSLRRNIQTSGSLKAPESGQADDLEFWKKEFEDVSPEKLGAEVSERSGEKKNDWDRGIEQLQQRLKSPADLDDWLNEPNNL